MYMHDNHKRYLDYPNQDDQDNKDKQEDDDIIKPKIGPKNGLRFA